MKDEIEASDRCDVSRILFSEGITAPRIREAITDAHFEADERTRSGALATSTTRDVKQWSALADLLVSRGLDAHVALSASWNQVSERKVLVCLGGHSCSATTFSRSACSKPVV